MIKEDTNLVFDVETVLAQFNASTWLESYWNHLSVENAKVNLVSRETKTDDFRRIVAEALFPFTQIDGCFDSHLDIGSGGGIPAVPILLSGRSTGPVTLYERTKKKALALERMLAALGLAKTTVVPESFGEMALKNRFSLVTMSYVTLTPELLATIENVMAPGGKFVYYSKPEFKRRLFRAQTWTYSQQSSSVHKRFTIFFS